GRCQRLLALAELGDVAIDAEQAAVTDRLERELDVAACRQAALVARPGRVHDPRRQLPHLLLDVLDRTVIAALNRETEDVRDGLPRPPHFGWIAHHVVEPTVGELPAQI